MAAPNSGQQVASEHKVNGAATTDISMAESSTPQEDISEERPATPTVDILPPIASPIQSPMTPDERIEINANEDVQPVTTSLSNMREDTVSHDLAASQSVGSDDNIYGTHTQSEPHVESGGEVLANDPESTFLPEATPTHVQEATTVAGSRNLAATQPLEAVPVQMANNEQGSAARVYINTKVTPVLLEGLKWVAKNEPDRPLKWLSEYLAKRSAAVEGN